MDKNKSLITHLPPDHPLLRDRLLAFSPCRPRVWSIKTFADQTAQGIGDDLPPLEDSIGFQVSHPISEEGLDGIPIALGMGDLGPANADGATFWISEKAAVELANLLLDAASSVREAREAAEANAATEAEEE